MRRHRLRTTAAITIGAFGLGLATPAFARWSHQTRAQIQASATTLASTPTPAPAATPAQTLQPGQPAYAAPTYAPAPSWPSPGADLQLRRETRRPQYGLIAGGASMLGGMYLIHMGVAFGLFGDDNTWPSAIPLLGPWIQMGLVREGSHKSAINGLCAFSGLVQLTGLALLIAGAAVKKRVPAYASRVQLMPYAGATGSGLVIAGTF